VITIQGNDRGRGVDKIIADVQARLSELDLPRGYAISYAGDTEEMEKSGRFLVKAFGMALGGILVILVIQFNSAILPIVILFSVLLSLIGVLWGLLITGMRFGVIMTGLGVISLAGIVVNNAIVLIDAINQRRRSGMSAEEALVDAGRTRLRPVLLTAATTILGLIPMAVGYSIDIHKWPPSFITGAESSAWWAPMAVAVIFGLALATVLTLVFVPVMYSLVDSAAQAVRSRLSAEKDPGGLRPPRDD
jgi:multidrug efflux pump